MNKANHKLERLRTLKKHTDKNLQYLMDEACQILETPLVLYDIDFKILAYSDTASNDGSFWNQFIHNGAIKQGIKDIYVNEGLSDIIVSPQKSVFLSNDKLKYNWLFGKIYDKDNLPVACIHVLSSNNSFVDDDLAAVDALCKTLSGAILKIPYYQNFAQRKLDMCITTLIDREIKDTKEKLYIAGYVEMVYKSLKNDLYLAVADISQCDPSYSKLEYYRDLFKQMRPTLRYAIYLNHIIIIMSTSEKVFYPKRCLSRLSRLFDQENIKVGISRRFENLFELTKSYNEAVIALNNGLASGSKQHIFVYDDAPDSSI